jgi:hypothetical protein
MGMISDVRDAGFCWRPDNRHFRDYPKAGYDADVPKSTRSTQLGHAVWHLIKLVRHGALTAPERKIIFRAWTGEI